MAADVEFTHSYPYDTAEFSAATTVSAQESKAGKAFPAETTEAFCDGHNAAFHYFGGVPVVNRTGFPGGSISWVYPDFPTHVC